MDAESKIYGDEKLKKSCLLKVIYAQKLQQGQPIV
jgi:hypothetical protein